MGTEDTRPVVGIEITPCEDDGKSTFPTTVEDAQFWTVYLRRQDGDFVMSDALHDYPTQAEAEAAGLRLCVEHNTVLPIGTMGGDYTPPQGLYTRGQVDKAMDDAWDAMVEAIGLPDGARDALKLMSFATVAFLTGEATTLREVVQRRYDRGITLRKVIDSIENNY